MVMSHGLKKNSYYILNRKGQFAIEAVLLMTVLVGAFLFTTKTVREKKLLQNFIAKPADNIAAMTGFGTWKSDGCTSPGKSKQTIGKCHPNSIHRSLSSDPGL